MRTKQITALFLLACILLTGCGNAAAEAQLSGSTSQEITGGYVQTDTTPQNFENTRVNNIVQWDDGTLLATANTVYTGYIPRAFTSSDGTDWEEVDNSAFLGMVSDNLDREIIYSGTYTQAGDWWVVRCPAITAPPEDELGIILYKYSGSAAEPEEIQVPFLEELEAQGERVNIYRTIQNGQGKLCLEAIEAINYSKYYYIILDSQTGEQLCVIEADGGQYSPSGAALRDDQLYLMDMQSTLHAFSMETGEETETYPLPDFNLGMNSVVYAIDAENSFCYVDKDGIHKIALGGTMVQNIVDNMTYIYSNPDFYTDMLYADANGSYYVSGVNINDAQLFRFDFDSSYAPNMEDAISIWALEDSYAVRAAASVYSSATGGAPVDLEFADSTESGQTTEDMIRTLNTRLLADDAPDVVIVDGLPVESYADAGILEDLSGQFDFSGCYENIANAYTYDGKLYAVPALFKMPLLMTTADNPRAGSVHTLADIAALSKEEGQLYFGSYAGMFEPLYAGFSAEIFPEGKSLNEEALREFLSATKEISDALSLRAEDEYRHGGYGGDGYITPQSLGAYQEHAAAFAAEIMNDVMDTHIIFTFLGEQTITPLPGSSFIPQCVAAVPVNAANKEAAMHFIQIMLGEENVQAVQRQQGFAVQKGIDQKTRDRIKQMTLEDPQDYYADNLAHSADFDWDGLIASFENVSVQEVILKEKVYTQALRLYEGKTDLESAVKDIAQSTQLYFDEQMR